MKQIEQVLLFIVLLFFIKTVASAEVLKPQTVAEFEKTSVRVLNQKMNSGGTGSILRSSKTGTEILTNKHVCRLIEPGGYVERQDKAYKVVAYKKFSDHDLCLVKIKQNLEVNTEVSNVLAKQSDKVIVSGHPNLLPHILTVGHLSGTLDIELVVGIKKGSCDEDPILCMIFGGEPVVKTFESQVVSNLIKPGSSGSAVFNSSGEIVGVIFAGSGRDFSHGFIVPHKYVRYFMAIEGLIPFTPVGTKVDDGGLDGRIFNFSKCSQAKSKKAKALCNNLKDSFIWNKDGEYND
jgi:S1-C subfamily serine protease